MEKSLIREQYLFPLFRFFSSLFSQNVSVTGYGRLRFEIRTVVLYIHTACNIPEVVQQNCCLQNPIFLMNMSVRKITSAELATVIKGGALFRKEVIVVDVRDEDRAEGYIPQSLHLPSKSLCRLKMQEFLHTLFSDRRRLFEKQTLRDEANISKCTLVFHCMFSQQRGPAAAALCVDVMREINIPEKDTASVSVLSGGFQMFYQMYPTLVSTQAP